MEKSFLLERKPLALNQQRETYTMRLQGKQRDDGEEQPSFKENEGLRTTSPVSTRAKTREENGSLSKVS